MICHCQTKLLLSLSPSPTASLPAGANPYGDTFKIITPAQRPKKNETNPLDDPLFNLKGVEIMRGKISAVFLILSMVGLSGNSSLLLADHYEPSRKQKAVIIGGGTAAGVVLGGLLGGKRGALGGAIAGASGGAIYDEAKR